MVQTELPALKSSVKASPISPNSAQTQQTNNDFNPSHKILVILVSLLTAVLIILSVLITITIVLCVLKNKRKREKHQNSKEEEDGNVGHCSSGKRQSASANNKKNVSNKNKKLCHMTATKSSDDSIATSDGSAHPDLIPCDGSAAAVVQQLFYNNDHNIIDDNSCDNTFNANNSLSMYRDIIISGGAAVLTDLTDIGNVSDRNPYNERRISNNKNLLTNHTNRVSVINDRHSYGHTMPDNVLLVQTHHSQRQSHSPNTNLANHTGQPLGQPLDTYLAKYPAIDSQTDIEVICIIAHTFSFTPFRPFSIHSVYLSPSVSPLLSLLLFSLSASL